MMESMPGFGFRFFRPAAKPETRMPNPGGAGGAPGERAIPRAAFTLVETIVAVAVAAVAMSIAAVAVAGGHRLVARMAASGPAFDDGMERQAALETLRMDLASALPSSDLPFSGDASGFRCLSLLSFRGSSPSVFTSPSGMGLPLAGRREESAVPVLVEWGLSPSGGMARRISALDGTALRTDVFPQEWGAPKFGYRRLAPSGAAADAAGVIGETGTADVPARIGLADSVDVFSAETGDSAASGSRLPAIVEVTWCGFDRLFFPVPCAATPGRASSPSAPPSEAEP